MGWGRVDSAHLSVVTVVAVVVVRPIASAPPPYLVDHGAHTVLSAVVPALLGPRVLVLVLAGEIVMPCTGSQRIKE